MLAGKAGANLSEATFMCYTLGQTPGHTHKYYTRLDRLARNKHSILLRTFVNYDRKKFITLGPERNQVEHFEL
jgi:hypothetical protein